MGQNKYKLEAWLKTEHPGSYGTLVKKIFELVINDDSDEDNRFDESKMVVIDHGDYQGTQLFIIPKKGYQPSASDYLVTHNYYGSCSCCDALQSICEYSDVTPNEKQVDAYMVLALHLIQKMKYIVEN